MSYSIGQMYDLVEYRLESQYGSIVCEEPRGWKDDLMDLKRSDQNFTIVTKYATNLEFYGQGAEFIKETYRLYGFEEKITLTKVMETPYEINKEVRYRGFLDGYTFSQKEGKVKINIMESDMIGKIKGYQGEKVELQKETSLGGDSIGELSTERVNIIAKKLLLVSNWGIREGNESLLYDNAESTKKYVCFPLDNQANSHVDAADVTNYFLPAQSSGLPQSGSTQNMFLATMQEAIAGRLNIDVDIEITDNGANQLNFGTQRLYLVSFSYLNPAQDLFTYSSRIPLEDAVPLDPVNDPSGSKGLRISHKSTRILPVFFNQSFALAVYSDVPGGGEVLQTYKKLDVEWITVSVEEGAQIDCILPFELFDRLLRHMTGRTDTVLISDYFGRQDLGYEQDGEGAYLGITSGFVARGFQDKPIATNWRDAIRAYETVSNIAFTVEKRGLQEYVRMEPVEYFFTNRVSEMSKRVDEKNLKIAVSERVTYSGIEIGYEEGGDDYEEADGLDEPCGLINWATPLSKADNKYERISPYRADSVGLIFALRKPKNDFPTTDTPYDNNIFLIDMKTTESDVLAQRVWQDDFLEEPTGLYDPPTATNLRLTPAQLIKRHYNTIKSCLYNYNNRHLIFGSGIGNVTIGLDGEDANRDIPISEMDKELFQNISVDFSYDTDRELEDAISDNIYGIFEFKDSKGFIRRFRLFEFKKNKYKGLLINGIQ